MAPASESSLLARYYCSSYDVYGNCYYNSSWNVWGRWVALVGIVLAALLIAFLCSCMNARRRRRRGAAPYYGTGWLGGNNYNGGQNPQYYNNTQPQYEQTAPAYSPPAQKYQNTGNTFNSNDGYYGQQSGIEMQPPQNSYQPQRGGQNVYEAPQGPPPGKSGYQNDGVIR